MCQIDVTVLCSVLKKQQALSVAKYKLARLSRDQ